MFGKEAEMETQCAKCLSVLPIAFLLIGIPIALLLTVLPFWFICKKAGFHGALSLVMLIPIGNIILPFVLAFAEWPVLKERAKGASELAEIDTIP